METAKDRFSREIDQIIKRTQLLNRIDESMRPKYLEAQEMIKVAFNGLRAADQFDKNKDSKSANTLRAVSLGLLLEGSITTMQIESRLSPKQPAF
jgi:hypothetical protein